MDMPLTRSTTWLARKKPVLLYVHHVPGAKLPDFCATRIAIASRGVVASSSEAPPSARRSL